MPIRGGAFARASALAGVSKSGEGVEHDRSKREVTFGRASEVLADILNFSCTENQSKGRDLADSGKAQSPTGNLHDHEEDGRACFDG